MAGDDPAISSPHRYNGLSLARGLAGATRSEKTPIQIAGNFLEPTLVLTEAATSFQATKFLQIHRLPQAGYQFPYLKYCCW